MVFCGRVEGHTKEDDGFEASLDEGSEEGNEFVDTPLVLAGEAGHWGFFVGVVSDEERVYEHFLGA